MMASQPNGFLGRASGRTGAGLFPSAAVSVDKTLPNFSVPAAKTQTGGSVGVNLESHEDDKEEATMSGSESTQESLVKRATEEPMHGTCNGKNDLREVLEQLQKLGTRLDSLEAGLQAWRTEDGKQRRRTHDQLVASLDGIKLSVDGQIEERREEEPTRVLLRECMEMQTRILGDVLARCLSPRDSRHEEPEAGLSSVEETQQQGHNEQPESEHRDRETSRRDSRTEHRRTQHEGHERRRRDDKDRRERRRRTGLFGS